jgi:hypothetical protein
MAPNDNNNNKNNKNDKNNKNNKNNDNNNNDNNNNDNNHHIMTKQQGVVSSKRILVFVVRHGERDDEVVEVDGRRKLHRTSCWSPRQQQQQRLDPALTVQGHGQAQVAFELLVAALSACAVRRVALFSSPLRRAIGTAMMISMAATTTKKQHFQNNNLLFVVPTSDTNIVGDDDDDNDDEDEKEEEEEVPIPIVVWNGLCDCAAQVARLGGHQTAIRTGFVACAASPANSVEPYPFLSFLSTWSRSPMHKVWQELKRSAMAASDLVSSSSSFSMKESSTASRSIQFWKAVAAAAAPESSKCWRMIPMTPPVSLRDHEDDSSSSIEPHPNHEDHNPAQHYSTNGHNHIHQKKKKDDDDDDDDSPMDQVVRMSMNAGCDVCIVVSHREEIRNLYKHKCGYRWHRKSLPYCCIGRFEVVLEEVDDDDDEEEHVQSSLRWTLHDVTPPEELDVASVVQSSMFSRMSSTTRPETCHIQWSVPGQPTLSLCEAALVLEDSSRDWVSMESCILTTTAAAAGSDMDIDIGMDQDQDRGSLLVELEIIRGHFQWLQFLYELKGRTAFGTVLMKRSDQSIARRNLRVYAHQQPQLPCPPKSIQAELLPF